MVQEAAILRHSPLQMFVEGSRTVRLIAAIATIALLGGACGGRPQVFADERAQREAEAAFQELELPDVIPAVPSFTIESAKPLSPEKVRAIARIEGVALAVPVSSAKVRVSSKRVDKALTVAAVPTLDYRSVAPVSTRAADFVWFALMGGDGVMTPEAAEQLKLGNSTKVQIKGLGPLRLGALADNSTPNFADIVVDGDAHPIGRVTKVVVGAESGVTLNGLAREIRTKLDRVRMTWLLPKTEAIATQEAAAAVASTASFSAPSIAGLHPALAESVARLVAASQGRVWVVSGFRDSARQYELWVQALQKYGDPEIADNWVAPPGSSYHERGLAVDLGGDLALAARLVEELGLPLWRPMSWEPWHFELAGSRG